MARLTCQVHGIPEANITWQKDHQALSTDDPRFVSSRLFQCFCARSTTLPCASCSPRYTLLPNGVLQITGVRRTDGGSFRCVASNIANTRFSREAQLSVNGKSRLRPFLIPVWTLRVSHELCGSSCRIQDLSRASHSVWASEPHHQRPPDCHPRVHRHRQPAAHRVLESPW